MDPLAQQNPPDQTPSASPDANPSAPVVGTLYDVVVIGGGPAGCAAAVYTARKQLKTLLIAESFGGQSIVSDDIRNWIGDKHVSGVDLAKKLEDHIRDYPEMVEVKAEKVTEVKNIRCLTGTDSSTTLGAGRICDFEVHTDKGGVYQTKTVIVASGARRRELGVPGEEKFKGKGMAYCSTCDAPVFVGKKVAVVGGGNAGLEAVHDLFAYATEVYLIEGGETLRGDEETQADIKKNPKLKEVLLNTQILEVIGDQFVSGLKVKNKTSGEERVLEVGGVFAEIGSVPNSEMVKDLVQLDEHSQIRLNFQHARTSHPGVFAAGDVTDDPYKQNNISAGDGVRAALSAYAYLINREKTSPAAEKPQP